MIAWIESQAGPYRPIEIPYNLKGFTFENFCDFKTEESKFFDATEREEPEEAIAHMKTAVSIFFKGAGLEDLPISLPGEDIDQKIKDRYLIAPGDKISLFSLYPHLITVINQFIPEQIPTEIKINLAGDTYTITNRIALEAMLSRPVTTGEALEVLEYRNRAGQQESLRPIDGGNIDFNLGLTEMAILLRKKGERLPANKAERDRFIERRKKLFRAIPLEEVLATRFFFIQLFLRYGKTPIINFFGKVHQVPMRRPKRTRK